MNSTKIKIQKRKRRHKKIRSKVKGSALRPRFSVYKSNRYMHVQLIDDERGRTLVALLSKKAQGKTKVEQAREAGSLLARKAAEKKIHSAVFDRGGSLYTGRIRACAEGAREGGLKF
jgi:large subunit ribosomal protein L18